MTVLALLAAPTLAAWIFVGLLVLAGLAIWLVCRGASNPAPVEVKACRDLHCVCQVLKALARMEKRLEKVEEQLMGVNANIQELSDRIVELKAAQADSAQKVTDAFARLEAAIAAGGQLSEEDKAVVAAAKDSVVAMTGAEQAQSAQADAEAPPAAPEG
ncbi:MAG TPA: hypothetical protein PLB01_00220 [Thermoanaerobaculia bacterium]|nr:hypothetical protein [Thermoanaerobaculia bacterium]